MGARARRLGMAGYAVALVGLPVAGAPAWAASAPAARLAWSTYLRAGPGETFKALDELDHSTRISVAGCDAKWCRVNADGLEGYVDRDAITLPGPPAPQPQASDCVVVAQAGAPKPEPTRFCTPAPTPSVR